MTIQRNKKYTTKNKVAIQITTLSFIY